MEARRIARPEDAPLAVVHRHQDPLAFAQGIDLPTRQAERRALDERVEAWLRELRGRADVRYVGRSAAP